MRNIVQKSVILLIVYPLLVVSSLRAELPAAVNGAPLPTLAPMLDNTMPAVVNISTRTEINVQEHPLLRDPVFRHFFQIPQQQRKRHSQSLGSGVIIDASKGYLLTNNHVIDKADEILVTLRDGRQLNATVVGTDPESDVAVIQIPSENLTEIPLANSDALRVGDFVVAIGNPFGLGQTVTSGIVSALGRSGLGIEGYEDFIQTDASINPGNSGGALVNLRGELIGINTAILAPSGGNVGIGFAIPTNMAMKIMASLVEHGEVRRGLLGISVQDLTPQLVQAFDLDKKRGAVISRVQDGSPAERADLQPGDIIVAINGRAVKNSASIRNHVGLLNVGDKINLEIIRGGETMAKTATIGKPQTVTLSGGEIHPKLKGTMLRQSQKNQVEGILIDKIETSSYPWQTGLRPGDIIVIANRYRVRSLEEFQSAIDKRQSLLLNIQRGNEAFFVVLR
ncbi:MAG: DegQ family serine endoprotease [Methylococcales bacterium]